MRESWATLFGRLWSPPGSTRVCKVIVLQPLVLYLLCYLAWKFSPNRLTAIIIISFTTTVPISIMALIFNKLILLLMLSRNILPTMIFDAFCDAVKLIGPLTTVIHGKLIHGYEIHGKENLPQKTGSLLVYYHGLIPYDTIYLIAELYLRSRTTIDAIVNRELTFLMAGVCELFNFHCDRDRVAERLKQGVHCAVAPGGGIEGTLSKNYEIMWNGRVGFAKKAKECNVPVVPMFTANIQQSMPITTYGFHDYFLDVYRRTKTHFYFPVFCFPAKLRIYLGEPLFCGSTETPEEFAERVKIAINDLRDKHQRQPGSFTCAILERFGYRAASGENNCTKKSS